VDADSGAETSRSWWIQNEPDRKRWPSWRPPDGADPTGGGSVPLVAAELHHAEHEGPVNRRDPRAAEKSAPRRPSSKHGPQIF